MTDNSRIPEAPFPIGAETNCKRVGWNAFFEGKPYHTSPFPVGRVDLQRRETKPDRDMLVWYGAETPEGKCPILMRDLLIVAPNPEVNHA